MPDWPDITPEKLPGLGPASELSCYSHRIDHHPGMVSLTIKLPLAVKQRLEREARESGKSVSALIRELVSARLRSFTAGHANDCRSWPIP